MLKGFKQKIENTVNRWLFKDEIDEHERQVESGVVPRPQNGPTDAEKQVEMERVKKLHDEQMTLIKAEVHSQPPTSADVVRYHEYHVNFVENMHLIEKHTGNKPPFNVPSKPLKSGEYNKMVEVEGWTGLRMSCGLPTGDLTKPRKPWTMGDGDKAWKTKDEPEIHWKTKE
jgi:hypothetical protein